VTDSTVCHPFVFDGVVGMYAFDPYTYTLTVICPAMPHALVVIDESSDYGSVHAVYHALNTQNTDAAETFVREACCIFTRGNVVPDLDTDIPF
jgi:hypothetical protein